MVSVGFSILKAEVNISSFPVLSSLKIQLVKQEKEIGTGEHHFPSDACELRDPGRWQDGTEGGLLWPVLHPEACCLQSHPRFRQLGCDQSRHVGDPCSPGQSKGKRPFDAPGLAR